MTLPRLGSCASARERVEAPIQTRTPSAFLTARGIGAARRSPAAGLELVPSAESGVAAEQHVALAFSFTRRAAGLRALVLRGVAQGAGLAGREPSPFAVRTGLERHVVAAVAPALAACLEATELGIA